LEIIVNPEQIFGQFNVVTEVSMEPQPAEKGALILSGVLRDISSSHPVFD